MIKIVKPLLIFVLFFLLEACSTLSGLKFWENDEDEIEAPAELIEIFKSVSLDSEWNKKIGSDNNFGRLVPAFSNDTIIHISSNGYLVAIDSDSGLVLWTIQTEDLVSGAVTVGFKRIFYGTLDGDLVALDFKDGAEIWRSQVSSEILSPPVTNGSIVAAQTSDGKITGFNIKNGEQKWVHQNTIPKLTLRGTATPILAKGFIFTGFANGKVSMIYPDSGAIRLEIPVTINEGKSELERVIDIDGKSVVSNDLLVSASYQGNITAIDLKQGQISWQEKISSVHDLVSVRSRVIAIDEKDSIKGFGLSTGAILWQQDGLKLRGVSSPAALGGNFAIGDFEGYVHILDSKNGSFIGRKKVSKRPILEIISEGSSLVVVDDSGRLFFLSVS
jgi:outer membrane protein assembly factor BamB